MSVSFARLWSRESGSDERPMRLSRFPSLRDLNAVAVGAVTLAVVALIGGGAFAVGALDIFGSGYEVTAVFDNTGGMKPGARVRLAGVPIGEVTGIDPDFEAGQMIVTMAIDHGIDLGQNMQAEIAAITLLGGNEVRLTGPVVEPYLADLDADARRIPIERTQGPLSLVGVLSDTTDTVAAVDVEAVNDVLRELAASTNRNRDTVPEVLDSISVIGEAAAASQQDLKSLVASAETMTASLASREEEILRLMDAATILLDTLSERRDDLAVSLGESSEAVQTLTRTITEHRDAIRSFIEDTHVLFDGIGRNIDVINTSLVQAGPMTSLLANIANEDGGFDVAVEGFVVGLDQLDGLIGILIPPNGGGA